jgi:hypothetical protein
MESYQRRKGFYIRPEKISASDYFKKRLDEIEKELESKQEKKQTTWRYIDRPNQSRLSNQQEIYMPYRFKILAIEKTIFGDYFYMRYILSRTTDICVLMPNLDLAIDAIKIFYDIQKEKIPLQSWPSMGKLLPDDLYRRYKNTFELVMRNQKFIWNALKPTVDGPRLQSDNQEYDRLILSLIKKIMESQRIEIDVDTEEPIVIPDVERLNQCLISGKRYIAFFIRLKFKDGEGGAHANMMIMDTKNKTVERFEPHGIDHELYDDQRLDKRIKAYFERLGYKYIPSSQVCKMGVQGYIESKTEEEYDISGFCKTWSLLYALLRLILIEDSEPEMMEDMIGMAMKVADEYFEEKNKKVEKEDFDFVIEFLYAFIPEILQEGKEEIEKINEKLGTTLNLDGRMIHSKS